MSTTVHVSNISPDISEHDVREFFSFCGKISSISVTPSSGEPNSPKSATVTFEKETAAKTALLLDNTKLGSSNVHVEAGQGIDQLASGKTATSGGDSSGKDDEELAQEDKPRSRILAEYMAHGYSIGDKTLQRALDLDKQHGISSRFTAYLQQWDQKFHASDRAKSMDAAYGVSGRAQAGWRGLQSYFEKAMNTPTGQRLRAFYTQTEKQVLDIHNEARHLAELRKQEQGGQSGSGGKDQSDAKVSPVPGTDKTTSSSTGQTATGPAADIAAAAHLQPLGSNMPGQATGSADEYTKDSKLAPAAGSDLAGQRG